MSDSINSSKRINPPAYTSTSINRGGLRTRVNVGAGEPKAQHVPIASDLKPSRAINPKELLDKRSLCAGKCLGIPGIKPASPKCADCEGLVHFMQTGKWGHYSEAQHKSFSQKACQVKDLSNPGHKPNTGYFLFAKNKDYMQEAGHGEWGFQHAFFVNGDGKYLSKNGGGPIDTFDSYKEMLVYEGFRRGFVDENGKPIKLEGYPHGCEDEDGYLLEYEEGMIPPNAVVAECKVFTLSDVTGDFPPPKALEG
jgi:hypothetical protein